MQKADVFQAVSDASRRRILGMLTQKSMTINSLAENFSMSRPAVSKHIKILHEAGFINIRDIGRERHCILQQKGFSDLQKWIDYFDNFWAGKLKKLETLLAERAEK